MLRYFKIICRNNKGFSLVEIVLFIVMSGILLGVTTDIMLGQLTTYSFLSSRQNTLSDARYALNRVSNDLLRIPTGGLIAVDASSIDFIDSQGFSTSFNLTSGELRRGAETLLESVSDFQVSALDANGDPAAVLTDIKKFQVTIVTAPLDNEGSLTLSTSVTPRVLVYNSYQ